MTINDYKNVVVTGASSGIGRETAIALCKEDYIPILSSRKKEKLIKLQNDLADYGYKTHVIPCDVSNENEVKNLYEESLKLGFVKTLYCSLLSLK